MVEEEEEDPGSTCVERRGVHGKGYVAYRRVDEMTLSSSRLFIYMDKSTITLLMIL